MNSSALLLVCAHNTPDLATRFCELWHPLTAHILPVLVRFVFISILVSFKRVLWLEKLVSPAILGLCRVK